MSSDSPNFGLPWIDRSIANGRSTFTTAEAHAAHGGSEKAAQAVLRRLRAKGEIASPVRGFHVIVPPEYRRLGCLPPLWFVDDLAAFLGQPYYVALLSAAELHGAAHQRPQAFQVMLPWPQRPAGCGGVRIDFAMRRNLAEVPIVVRNTPKGTVRVATPELTAFDLVGYPERAAGLDNAATVLAELAESLDPDALVALAPRAPLPWAQRLGFLLDHVGAAAVVEPLARWVSERSAAWCPLAPGHAGDGAPRDPRWRVTVNHVVEVDA
ncbi:MAG: type IV toxin-antitoxin system AbiEi family antitoxin [Pseudomonadota bacterium]